MRSEQEKAATSNALTETERSLSRGVMGGAVMASALCAVLHATDASIALSAFPLIWLVAFAWGRELHFTLAE